MPVDIISDSCAFQQSSWGKKYNIVKRVAIKKDDTDNISFLNIIVVPLGIYTPL